MLLPVMRELRWLNSADKTLFGYKLILDVANRNLRKRSNGWRLMVNLVVM